jgi:uncharacterized protein with HEPN domain
MPRDKEAIFDILESINKILIYVTQKFLGGILQGFETLLHDYNPVDVESIWDVVQSDLPELLMFFNSLEQ